ncbi:hypothetical protein ACFL2C_03430 [Patescibacteria group bacterium]
MVKLNKGQSLFEVVFAIAIATVVLTGVVFLATSTIRNSTFSKNKAEATKFTQEAAEWLREQKDQNWDNLATHISPSRCLGDLNWASGCVIVGTIFSRSVSLTQVGDDIEAQVIVTWTDGLGEHQVKSITTYTNWRSI